MGQQNLSYPSRKQGQRGGIKSPQSLRSAFLKSNTPLQQSCLYPVAEEQDKIPGMKKLSVLLMLLPVFAHAFAHAGWDLFDFKSDEIKNWVELDAPLPPYPLTKNLILFNVSAVTRNQHFVDATSISVGKDDVVRYTVVIDTVGGAKNVSYEGMRCSSGERRIYAYGHPDGTWSLARNTAWEKINASSAFSYQKALYEDHFCPSRMGVKDGAEAVRNLRRAAQ